LSKPTTNIVMQSWFYSKWCTTN